VERKLRTGNQELETRNLGTGNWELETRN